MPGPTILNDTIYGTNAPDTINANMGNDVVYGEGGNDHLNGGMDHDVVYGGAGVDRLYGDKGNDLLAPGPTSGSGWDAVQRVSGGEGDDTISYIDYDQGVWVRLHENAAEMTEITGIENVWGSAYGDHLIGDVLANEIHGNAGADRLEGREGADTLMGGEGNDTLAGGTGADYMNGGNGFDIIELAGSNGAQTAGANLEIGTTTAGDLLYSIEGVIGTAGSDTLQGGHDNNLLSGGAGDDVIAGLTGSDTLIGGNGADMLWGGTAWPGDSKDIFRYESISDSTSSSRDVIHDFQDVFYAQVGGFTLRSNDVIDLSMIDADATAAGNQAFHIMEGGFTGGGQMRILHQGDNTFIDLSVNDDAYLDMQIQLKGTLDLNSDHFIF
jgi:serralysin